MTDKDQPTHPMDVVLTPAERDGGATCSMHNGVEVSCDCCSCEAEPYWIDSMRGDPQLAEGAASSD